MRPGRASWASAGAAGVPSTTCMWAAALGPGGGRGGGGGGGGGGGRRGGGGEGGRPGGGAVGRGAGLRRARVENERRLVGGQEDGVAGPAGEVLDGLVRLGGMRLEVQRDAAGGRPAAGRGGRCWRRIGAGRGLLEQDA